MTTDSSEPNRALSPASRAAEVLMIVAVFFVAAGDPAPGVNESHYLSRFKHYWDPSWCAGDLFLESPDAHLTVVVLFGWVTRFVSLPVLAWTGRLAAWGLLAWAWQRLSWRVAPARWCSVLTAALWVTGVDELHLGGEWVVGGVEAKAFAYGLVLLALRNYLDDRWNRAWVLLGLACALHVIVGGWTVLVLFCLWAAYHRQQTSFRQMLPGLAAGGLISLAGLIPPVVMNWGADPAVASQGNQIYVFYRLPHHLAVLSMENTWLATRAGRHAVMLLLLAIVGWLTASARRRRDLPTPDDAALRLIRFAWGAATLTLIGFAIEFTLAGHPAAAASLQKYYWYRLSDVAAPLATALGLGALLAQAVARGRALAAVLLVVMVAAPGWRLTTKLDARVRNPIPLSESRTLDVPDWVDACRWVRENTPRDALFLVPHRSHTFKWRAGRAEVVTHKDVPQDAPSLVEWRRRIDNIYYDAPPAGSETEEPQVVASLGRLGAARLRGLGRQYGADYVITSRRPAASLPIAYQNATYVIYDLRAQRD